MVKILNYPINDTFYELVRNSKNHIKLCAPYVKQSIINKVYEIKNEDVSLEIISNFNIGNFYNQASDIEAFRYTLENNDKVYNHQSLHGKFYIFDRNHTIVTSANLTNNGFNKNLEYGVLIENDQLINQVILDYNKICIDSNTGIISSNEITNIQNILKELPKTKELNIPDLNIETDSILELDLKKIGKQLSTWKRLIVNAIEQISEEKFTLQDMYKFEKSFQKEYPNNNTIKNTIRRNLQELRDMGLIKFLGDGVYLKLWKDK